MTVSDLTQISDVRGCISNFLSVITVTSNVGVIYLTDNTMQDDVVYVVAARNTIRCSHVRYCIETAERIRMGFFSTDASFDLSYSEL